MSLCLFFSRSWTVSVDGEEYTINLNSTLPIVRQQEVSSETVDILYAVTDPGTGLVVDVFVKPRVKNWPHGDQAFRSLSEPSYDIERQVYLLDVDHVKVHLDSLL